MSKSTVKIYALHGFLGLPSDWDEFEVIPVVIKPESSVQAWAKRFNASVNPDDRNFMVGYSMGGRLGLRALLEKPAIWEKGIFLSTHLGLEEGHKERVQNDDRWAIKFEKDSWYEVVAEWMAQPVFKGSSCPLRKESDFDRKELAMMLRNYSLGKQFLLSQEEKAILQQKAHLLVGEKDLPARLSYPESIVVPNAGHRILFDNPSFLKSYLDKILQM